MSEDKLQLKKEKQVKATKGVFIDIDLHKQVSDINQETGLPIYKIVEAFIRYGIEHMVIVDE